MRTAGRRIGRAHIDGLQGAARHDLERVTGTGRVVWDVQFRAGRLACNVLAGRSGPGSPGWIRCAPPTAARLRRRSTRRERHQIGDADALDTVARRQDHSNGGVVVEEHLSVRAAGAELGARPAGEAVQVHSDEGAPALAPLSRTVALAGRRTARGARVGELGPGVSVWGVARVASRRFSGQQPPAGSRLRDAATPSPAAGRPCRRGPASSRADHRRRARSRGCRRPSRRRPGRRC